MYNLTQAELQRKDDKLGEILDDIAQQRARLASLLARLLAEKETRERELHNYLNDMEARRREIEDDDFWLVQYQRLMEQTSVESQVSFISLNSKSSFGIWHLLKTYLTNTGFFLQHFFRTYCNVSTL